MTFPEQAAGRANDMRGGLSIRDMTEIVGAFKLGELREARRFDRGTVQINTRVSTSQGIFVVKVYRNRSLKSVQFETMLLVDLERTGVPCPRVVSNGSAETVMELRGLPVAVFTYIEGTEPETLGPVRRSQVLRAVAELHEFTRGRRRYETDDRWNYTMEFSLERLREAASRSRLHDPASKLEWLEARVRECNLPASLPRGVCHCDFDRSNLLFAGDRLTAILDFDDANYTWLMMDLINLMENYAWEDPETPDWESCARIIAEYQQFRPLTELEKRHMFDAHRLQAAIDTAWFFDTGEYYDFVGRRRIEFLDSIGRDEYRRNLGIA